MPGDSPMTLPLVQHQRGLMKQGILSATDRQALRRSQSRILSNSSFERYTTPESQLLAGPQPVICAGHAGGKRFDGMLLRRCFGGVLGAKRLVIKQLVTRVALKSGASRIRKWGNWRPQPRNH